MVWRIDMQELYSLLPDRYQAVVHRTQSTIFNIKMLAGITESLEQYDRDMKDQAMVIIEPPSTNDRIINQYSFFSVVPTDMTDIEDFPGPPDRAHRQVHRGPASEMAGPGHAGPAEHERADHLPRPGRPEQMDRPALLREMRRGLPQLNQMKRKQIPHAWRPAGLRSLLLALPLLLFLGAASAEVMINEVMARNGYLKTATLGTGGAV